MTCKQGIIVLTGTWQIFFSYVCNIMPKENKELFTPTYNEITASVSLVSLTLVILYSRLSDWLWLGQKQ